MDYEANKHRFLDAVGRRVLKGLFHDAPGIRPNVLKFKSTFYLHEWKKVYMEIADPTEYKAAMELVGNWAHWQEIRNQAELKPIFDEWAEELRVKLHSEAINAMIQHSMEKGGTAAAKWLAEGGAAGKKKVGRPKKEEVPIVDEKESAAVAADLERLGLKVVNGGKQ